VDSKVKVSIVAPEKQVWSGDADMVVCRSPEGEFAILSGHIPFLAALEPGRVSVYERDSKRDYFVGGGFLEASGGTDVYHVIMLADSAETLDKIDVQEARRHLEEARSKTDRDGEGAQNDLRVAQARLDLVESRG
jgi:F-type H+-transporting ATPase subunit epsilon